MLTNDTPVAVPWFVPVIFQTSATSGPVSVLVPAPPLTVPDTLALVLILKLSLAVPPVRFSMPEKFRVPSVPLLAPVPAHVFAVFGPTSVSVPAPPARVSIAVNDTPFTVPALAALKVQVAPLAGPVSVSAPVPPARDSMFE